MFLKRSHRRGVYAVDAKTHALCEVLQDISRYSRNILATLS